MLFKNRLAALLASLMLLSAAAHARTRSFGIIGDAGKWNDSAKTVRDSIARAGVKDLILPGDNLYQRHSVQNPTYASVWDNWSSRGMSFEVTALGNHNRSYAEEIEFFRMPGEYYSKVMDGKVRFVVLNSDNTANVSEQAAWLDQELTRATEPLIFLVLHHPPYSLSQLHPWTEKRAFQEALRPLIWRHRAKLTALIVGHDHLASLNHFNDLPVILSGATHEARRDIPMNYIESSVAVRTDWYFEGNAYWARLDTDSDTHEAWVHFVRARDQRVSCSAQLLTGVSARLQSGCESVF